MADTMQIINQMKSELSRFCALRKEDIGADAHLAKRGLVFETESYALEGLGHLCVMRMKAPLGLMRMDTVVLSCTHRDVPLFNLDRVRVPGRETVIAELYDTQLAPWPQDSQDAFTRIKVRDFAQRLFAEGGPAVNQVTKLFGREAAARLILQHMYGVAHAIEGI